MDWFYSIAAVHIAECENCLVCSKQETPLAYHWYCLCNNRSVNGAPCLIPGSLSSELLCTVHCWRDAASVAYEIFVMLHLGAHMSSEVSLEAATAAIETSSKPSSHRRKRNNAKGKSKQPPQHHEECEHCDQSRGKADPDTDQEIAEFERRMLAFDHQADCDCKEKLKLPNAVYHSLQRALSKIMEEKRAGTEAPSS
jgi:hypothetical protein